MMAPSAAGAKSSPAPRYFQCTPGHRPGGSDRRGFPDGAPFPGGPGSGTIRSAQEKPRGGTRGFVSALSAPGTFGEPPALSYDPSSTRTVPAMESNRPSAPGQPGTIVVRADGAGGAG
jgi:hypothetical protein